MQQTKEANCPRIPLAQTLIAAILALALSLAGLTGCASSENNPEPETQQVTNEQTAPAEQETQPTAEPDQPQAQQAGFDYGQVPAFTGEASVPINGNSPFFTDDEIAYAKANPGFEDYGEQDSLGRCTAAIACIGPETMPKKNEERGDIGQVKPTGWHSVKYDSVPGKSLYNRCHLIGWQLSDENANAENLITGTRFMNVDGMVNYEDDIATYVKKTGNHVLYRVTPIFEGEDLLAHGVLMEARSVEDEGAGLTFCAYAYNAQPSISINYANGDSSQTPLLPAAGESSASTSQPSESEQTHTYILNTNTGKFHMPSCKSVAKMKEKNKQTVEAARSSMIAKGYEPCANCNP